MTGVFSDVSQSLCKMYLLVCVGCVFSFASTAQCDMAGLSIEVSECDDADRFVASLNFEYNDVGIAGFQVLGNGMNYGTFQYEDLPIAIEGLLGNCSTQYEFIVRDVQDPTCSTFIELGEVCCSAMCELSIVDLEIGECTADETFTLTFSVESQDTDGQTMFDVFVNGEFQEAFPYGESSYSIEGLTSDIEGLNSISICNNDSEDCCTEQHFLNPCECALVDVSTEIIECDDNTDSYYAIIDFDHVATNDSFQLGYSEGGINNFLGIHAYTDLPITVGPIGMSTDPREILIVDLSNFLCFGDAYFGVVDDCEINCQLSNLFAETYDCEGGEYYMDLEFDAEDLEGHSFSVLVDDVEYGTFTYGEASYTVGPLPENCVSAPVLEIQDLEVELCSDFFLFDEPICCGGSACEFTLFETRVECSDEDGVVIFADYNNPGAMVGDEFFVVFQETIYGPYPPTAGAAIFNVQELENGVYDISIFVEGDDGCSAESQVVVDCTEECELVVTEPPVFDCENLTLTIEFDVSLMDLDALFVSLLGTQYGPLDIVDNTVSFEAGNLANGAYQFQLYTENEACVAENEFIVECETNVECAFNDLEVFDIECDEGAVVSFMINFIPIEPASDSFGVRYNGVDLGNYGFGDLPITIEGQFDQEGELRVVDTADNDCAAETLVFGDCDPVEDCIIDDGVLEFLGCIDDIYSLSLDFVYESTSDSFVVEIDGVTTTFAYVDLPVILPDLPVGQESRFVIYDQLDPDCMIVREFFLADCELSSNDAFAANVTMLPNPNGIEIVNESSEAYAVEVYDVNGRSVTRSKMIVENTRMLVDMESSPTGLYIVRLLATDGRSASFKTVWNNL